jgi:hypothetical protein
VAAKLAQLAFNLRGMREREVGVSRREHVEAVDLKVNRRLTIGIAEAFDELVDRL